MVLDHRNLVEVIPLINPHFDGYDPLCNPGVTVTNDSSNSTATGAG